MIQSAFSQATETLNTCRPSLIALLSDLLPLYNPTITSIPLSLRFKAVHDLVNHIQLSLLFYYLKGLDLHLCRKRVVSLVVASLHLIINILDIKGVNKPKNY